MATKSYSTTIEVAKSPIEVYNAILNVPKWWSKDFEGQCSSLNDEFIINHPNLHFSKQKLIEVVPGKRIVWQVIDSNLNWLKNDKQEWTNTKMIFDIGSKGDKTMLHFTHEGLLPERECYSSCEKGWNLIIKDWLYHLITTGTESKGMEKASEIRNQQFKNANNSDKKDFHTSIIVNCSPEEAMKKISQVNHWWKEDYKGDAGKLNSTFTVPFGDPSFVDFIVSEMVPGRKLVWKVTDCFLPWFQDKKEWNNTEVIFEISENGNGKSQIDFTHKGLVPEIECYEVCEKGWTGHIATLERFINTGEGI
jgi:Activator of Hsp90 ATPase homolog 1-like protein.